MNGVGGGGGRAAPPPRPHADEFGLGPARLQALGWQAASLELGSAPDHGTLKLWRYSGGAAGP